MSDKDIPSTLVYKIEEEEPEIKMKEDNITINLNYCDECKGLEVEKKNLCYNSKKNNFNCCKKLYNFFFKKCYKKYITNSNNNKKKEIDNGDEIDHKTVKYMKNKI